MVGSLGGRGQRGEEEWGGGVRREERGERERSEGDREVRTSGG